MRLAFLHLASYTQCLPARKAPHRDGLCLMASEAAVAVADAKGTAVRRQSEMCFGPTPQAHVHVVCSRSVTKSKYF